jgi:hypothetical protein
MLILQIGWVPVTTKFRHLYYILQYLGFRWLLFRIFYSLKMRLGYFSWRLPSGQWQDSRYALAAYLKNSSLIDDARYHVYRRSESPLFFFDSQDLARYQPFFTDWDRDEINPLKQSAKIAQGIYRLFSHQDVVSTFPPKWNCNPISNATVPAHLHWSKIDDFASGDIKVIWEQSRFTFAYDLVRAYARTQDEYYPQLFWQLFEDWYQHNPPLQGVNWKCGQEISFRVMAWCFALYGFLKSPSTTGARLHRLSQAIAVSGERVALNLSYALSQSNNHGISEALCLWTIGVLFPEFKAASQWERIGRAELEKQGRELIYDDGAFAQQSVNYHRVMLHDYLWVMRLGDIVKQPFTTNLKNRVDRASQFLYQLQDLESGQLPYYGAIDGALVLPLSNCDFRDFRPVVQAIYYLVHQARCFPPGLFDEDLLWLFGEESLTSPLSPPTQTDLNARDSGYYTIRRGENFAFTRCGSFFHRPSHADLLHLDLWWQGQNIAIDPGTYSYNAPSPWDRGLDCTRYHNTVTVDNLDQMVRGSKFLWLPWIVGKETQRQYDDQGNLIYWEGSHNGYHRLSAPVNYHRAVLNLEGDSWLVIDRLTSQSCHDYAVNWLFPDLPSDFQAQEKRLVLQTPKGKYHVSADAIESLGQVDLLTADPNSPRGWRSPYYYTQSPAISYQLSVANVDNAIFWSFFSPYITQIAATQKSIVIDGLTRPYELKLGCGNAPLIENPILTNS